MKEDGTYVGDLAAYAISQALGVSVQIFGCARDGSIYSPNPWGSPSAKKTVRLCYLNDNHWEVVIHQDQAAQFIRREQELGNKSNCVV